MLNFGHRILIFFTLNIELSTKIKLLLNFEFLLNFGILHERYSHGRTCALLNSVQKFIEIQDWITAF